MSRSSYGKHELTSVVVHLWQLELLTLVLLNHELSLSCPSEYEFWLVYRKLA